MASVKECVNKVKDGKTQFKQSIHRKCDGIFLVKNINLFSERNWIDLHVTFLERFAQ